MCDDWKLHAIAIEEEEKNHLFSESLLMIANFLVGFLSFLGCSQGKIIFEDVFKWLLWYYMKKNAENGNKNRPSDCIIRNELQQLRIQNDQMNMNEK